MKIILEEGCIGCGFCADICPKLFKIADDGFARLTNVSSDEFLDSLLEAKENCPVSIITFE